MGGHPGSGKSFSLRSLLAQVSGAAWGQPTRTKLVLIDGKYGEGLGMVAHLPGVVGPVATDLPSAQRALAWAHAQMAARYDDCFPDFDLARQEMAGRIIVVVDEVQTFSNDTGFVELLRKLTSQGRAAWVHVLISTHHPTIAVLNDSVLKHTAVTRIGLRVTSYKASEVVFGGPVPRADYLQGKGDSYVVTPSAIQRVQWAYLTPGELARMSGDGPEMAEWPEWDGSISQERRFTGAEIGATIAHAHAGGGRDTLKAFLAEHAGVQPPGSGRAGDLLKLGKEAVETLNKLGWSLCHESD
jgi:DNA segregation ATPase FtsK/SpoIIIE-like protein